MKILQINKFYYLKGGAERHLFELSKLLESNGHTVIPFSMQDPQNLPAPYAEYFAKPVGFDHFSLSGFFKFFHNWEAVRQLKRLLRDEKPDLAHLHNVAHQLTPSIIRVLKQYGIPVVMTLHDYQPICPSYQLYVKGKYCERCKGGKYYQCALNRCVKNSRPKSLMSMLELYLHRRIFKNYDLVDHFIAPSRFMAEVSAAFGLPQEKISVVYNFLGEGQRIELEADADYPLGDYLLYFGRLSEEKGINDLLEAISGTSAKLKVVGAGPEHESLQARSKALGLGRQTEFLGYQEGSELIRLIKQARAVVLPARWPENMPYSLIEALAAGRPLLVSRIGGLTELVNPGENGFTFAPGDPEDLRRAILKLEKADFQAMSEASKEQGKRFDSGQFYQKISQIYESLI
ncbi:glycosyltransferase family 4 protein [Candidatus Falkowbacteria bacterium]|nr:glycosyltransferase family 4 protein [Candidatus Falkowbacteria bacterium]